MFKLLIMEDDPFARKLYTLIFEEPHYQLVFTEDADEAVSILPDGTVDLLVLDVNLKRTYLNDIKVSGIDISQYIKKDERFSELPVLIVSASDVTMAGEDILALSSADGLVLKPIRDFNSFRKKVESLILDY